MNAKNSSNGGNVMILRKSVFFFTFFLCTLLAFAFQSSPEHELLFEKAKFTMETKGDLKQAVTLFKEIIEKYPEQRQYAAKSQFYIGLCFEKLGYAEAVKAYELVLQKYADQSEQVAAARARLAALHAEKPGGLSVTKIERPGGPFDVQTMSPDGTKIAIVVFDEGQNIAVFDLVTKRIELVTHFDWRSSVTYNAIWSPDGKKIAYKQFLGYDSSLMVTTLDGKARPILSAETGSQGLYDWLPDGSAVVASLKEDKDTNLGLVPATGGSFKALHLLEGDFHSGDSAAFADASPDGRHIVFADGPKRDAQNIYCIGTDGQSLQVLTDHTANDIQPRWSPDGKYVVFLSFRSGSKTLWGVSVKNGKPAGDPFIIQEMGQGTDLLNWTARGLAYSNSIPMWNVHMVPVDPETGEPEGRLEQLDYSPPGRNRGAVWSPDGKYIAFFSADRGGQPGKGNIVIMAVEGGQAREYLIPIDTFRLNWMMGLRWMPDSSGLGFFEPDEKGATMFRLTQASEKWETWKIPQQGYSRIEWSPSGKAFLYWSHGKGLVEHNLETGEERFIFRAEKEKNIISVTRDLRFSRDYKKLAIHRTDVKFKNNKLETVGEKIMVLDMSTVQARTIDLEGLINLSWWSVWSPDGQNLAVLNRVEDKPSEMFIVPSQGGTPNKVELTGSPIKGRFLITDWSPDGKHIAFEIRRSTNEIFMMKNIIPKK